MLIIWPLVPSRGQNKNGFSSKKYETHFQLFKKVKNRYILKSHIKEWLQFPPTLVLLNNCDPPFLKKRFSGWRVPQVFLLIPFSTVTQVLQKYFKFSTEHNSLQADNSDVCP